MQRIYFLDNLRALAILIVVFAHGLIPYTYADVQIHHFFFRNHFRYHFIDDIGYSVHFFTMPVFFLLAGFFTRASLLRHPLAEFINEKVLRLALPIVIGWIFFLPMHGTLYIANFLILLQHNLHAPVYELLNASQIYWATFIETLKNGDFFLSFFNNEHLWFLEYLLIFSGLSIFIFKYDGVFKKLSNIIFSYYKLPAILLLTLFFMTSTATIVVMPLFSTIPTAQSLLVYGFFFFYGWYLQQQPSVMEHLKSQTFRYTLSSFVSIFAYCIALHYSTPNTNNSLISITHAFALFTTLNAIIALFYRFFNAANKILRYISDASFWLYLMHIPVILILEVFFVDHTKSPLIEYVFTMGWTYFIFFMTYELLVKRTRFKSFYLGKYQFKFMRRWLTPKVTTMNNVVIE